MPVNTLFSFLIKKRLQQIELFRDADCDIVGLVVSDAQAASEPMWWLASYDAVLPGFEWLRNQYVDQFVCLAICHR